MTTLRPMQRTVPAYVLTLDGQTVTIRPKRVRRPEASVTVSWDQVYRWALLKRAPTKRKITRGLLATERRGQ